MVARPVALSLCLFCAGLPVGMSQGVTGDGPVSLIQTHMNMHSGLEDIAMNMTPVMAKASIPQEVVSMRRLTKTPFPNPTQLRLSCTTLATMCQLDPSKQEVLVEAKAHEMAIAAMRRFPDDWELQLACSSFLAASVHFTSGGDLNPDHRVACSSFLAASVQWKKPLAQVVGPAGAVDVAMAAVKRHPEVPAVRGLLSNIGSQCDFVPENRVRVNELGGIELALQLGEQYPLDADTQMSVQCFFSTQCGYPAENNKKMLELGYIPKSVKVMHDLPTSRAAGEAVFIFGMCFVQDVDDAGMEDAANLASMVDAGVIDELVNILRKGHGHFEDLDPIRAKSRVPISAYLVIARLAGANAAYRDALVGAGAIEAVQLSMEDVGASRESIGGLPRDGLSSACRALTQLSAGSPANLAAVKSSGAVDTANNLLKKRGPLDPARLACRPLLVQ